ncbi:DUF2087 domain-containing protein [Coriobacterium glomerans]
MTSIPSKQKYRTEMLLYLGSLFTPDRIYCEPEVNATLQAHFQDFAYLRRALVDGRILERSSDGSRYWLISK